MTNSAHVAPRSRIRSIRHALALLGGEALLDHVGPEGRMLRTVLAYERGRFDDSDVSGLSDMYYDAVEWATETVVQLG